MGFADTQDYELNMCTYVITKFLGKSVEAKPLGKIEIKFKDNGDFFVFDRPYTFAKNIAIGTMYIDHSGESRIENVRTGEYAIIDFKSQGFFSAKQGRGKISATVYDAYGEKTHEIFGQWTSDLSYKEIDSNDEPTLIWEMDKSYLDNKDYYYFSDFAMKLNMLNDKIRKSLPPTDSRFRPDQRLLEEGDIKNADIEKTRIEEKQRARNKGLTDYKPKYFKKDEEHHNELRYEYIGDYWKDKKENKWKNMPDLFGDD